MSIVEKINQLKKDKNVAILAHYYVDGEVQEIADYVGDSFYLSKIATLIPEQNILLCGVSFMGESVKLLCPNKTVLLPAMDADCPMAHMANVAKIKEIKETYGNEVAVVCYVNSTAILKSYSDTCVTSSNAYDVVSKLSQKYIYFIPDEHLGRYVAKQLPQKTFIFNDGFCHVHTKIKVADVLQKKERYPQAVVVAHPECKDDILQIADYVGSTSQMIEYVTNNSFSDCIVCSEIGILHELQKKNPNTVFHLANDSQVCLNMKKVTLEKIEACLREGNNQVLLSDEVIIDAKKPLDKMLELAK